MLFVREDIPARPISIEKAPIEIFFIELNLRRKNWIVNCSYNPHKNNISSHLEVISGTMDIHSFNYDNFIFFRDFNVYISDKAILDFCKSYNLKSLIKQPTCFKNPENPSCIDLFLKNRPRRFFNSYVIETGLSDFHMMTVSVMKIHYRKLSPKTVITAEIIRNFLTEIS